MDPKHHILRVASRAGCARDRLMVIVLVAGGCTGEELRHLTVLDALKLVHHRAKWASEEIVNYVNGPLALQIERLPVVNKQVVLDSLLFRSQTYGGMLDRTTVSRIFKRVLVGLKLRTQAPGGAISALRALHRVFYGEWPKWIVRAALDMGHLPGHKYRNLHGVDEYPPYLRYIGVASSRPRSRPPGARPSPASHLCALIASTTAFRA